MKKLEILKISFILRSDKKKTGMSPVLMQLYLSGRRAYLGTGYKASIDEWDFTLGKFKSTGKKYSALNDLLDRVKMDAINIFNQMRSINNDLTINELRDQLGGKDLGELKENRTLLALCDMYNSTFKQLVGNEINQITYQRYFTFKARLGYYLLFCSACCFIHSSNSSSSFF
jgi:hypothetical protein